MIAFAHYRLENWIDEDGLFIRSAKVVPTILAHATDAVRNLGVAAVVASAAFSTSTAFEAASSLWSEVGEIKPNVHVALDRLDARLNFLEKLNEGAVQIPAYAMKKASIALAAMDSRADEDVKSWAERMVKSKA
ncbi:MAG: hypothetical protein LCH79_20995 [Proteobacteria bacterium]|nr:hypothetical protein [Pseudomonadota bacterium]